MKRMLSGVSPGGTTTNFDIDIRSKRFSTAANSPDERRSNHSRFELATNGNASCIHNLEGIIEPVKKTDVLRMDGGLTFPLTGGMKYGTLMVERRSYALGLATSSRHALMVCPHMFGNASSKCVLEGSFVQRRLVTRWSVPEKRSQ
ncbi:unnamed protein product [Prorocentrum cordatum]|uniref:Altered inheritance of mitochondria protein 24, mitochondrial n=1 Tax=Prorocentrum cordatum TaxID=2364126 RepID=A0ABN9W3F5_9DINO|nr:unnamed protein product [Polarella glacialis]|mmetsp:Transcript_59308/g.158569  ORF Transcript_59308/g.158569 Transcript_59308/m.158569 type:complete len:146 (+) Transcript_59308:684-1121(+)